MKPIHDVDFLVIGSGIAGLTFALRTAPHGTTLLLTKKNRAESNSNYAQGGIAGVMSDDDDTGLHAADTMIAGAGLCNPDAVNILVNEGPDRIRDLMALGAHFNVEADSNGVEHLALGREGGHSKNRIVHAVDRTGWECERTLLTASKDQLNLQILEHYFVVDLAMCEDSNGKRCCGAFVLIPSTGAIEFCRAKIVLLATGGCGQVYKHTTNPAIATGDGVAMAWRAGASIANMEFIQFHPTALFHPEGKSFLITEAVRGEGGILRTLDGTSFMADYHPMADLAPRDIVARAIHAERQKRGEPNVVLDVTHLDSSYLKSRFPTIYERCMSLGIDMTSQPIPVVPAAHYACGGVITNEFGETFIRGLLAAGEVACTGVHGANRLASNSLLEAMVYGRRAADHVVNNIANLDTGSLTVLEPSIPSDDAIAIAQIVKDLHNVMNDNVGIVRNDSQLDSALNTVMDLEKSLGSAFSLDCLETRNMLTVAELIVRSAQKRKESRGLHYTTDYPDQVESERHDTILVPTSNTK